MGFGWPTALTRRRRVATPAAVPASLPPGQRVYAIGDVHGEAGLLYDLLGQIAADAAERGPADTSIVLLGDVIDRGRRSAELLSGLARYAHDRFVVLKGNHEAALVQAWAGDTQALGFWLRYGGDATLLSFGVAPELILRGDLPELTDALHRHVDPALIEWLDRLPLTHRIGDYLFVHAGVRPGVPIEEQAEDDLLWIRDPFLGSEDDHGAVIVHGHSIDGEVRLHGNRIGVDTGAHEHGRLSALGLEGAEQWVLNAEVADGATGDVVAD